jgi:3-methyladenine DNA glycosylase Mpg
MIYVKKKFLLHLLGLNIEEEIVTVPRVHIDYVVKYKDKLWRFLLRGMDS